MKILTLRCIHCGTEFPVYPLRSNCEKCGGTLDFIVDLPEARKLRFSGQLGFWRYKSILPPVKTMISLGEGGTPLHKAERLARNVGLKEVYLKDETRNPTNSYRDKAYTASIYTLHLRKRKPLTKINKTFRLNPQVNVDQKNQGRVTITVAQAGIMAALVAVTTALVQIYIPATRGYLNFGDIMIFVSAFTFGPVVGGFAGGVGSAISDAATGYAYFAPFTLVIKGAEGLIAGLISNGLSRKRDVLAVVVAGSEMVTGYFLAEFFGLSEGYAALVEVPANILQIAVGGTVGILVAFILRKRLPEAWRQTKPQTEEIQKNSSHNLKARFRRG